MRAVTRLSWGISGAVALLALSSPIAASSARSSPKDGAAEHHHHHGGRQRAEPPADDRDRDRIVRMQAALREILRGGVLGRVRVGMKVIEARTGRLFF